MAIILKDSFGEEITSSYTFEQLSIRLSHPETIPFEEFRLVNTSTGSVTLNSIDLQNHAYFDLDLTSTGLTSYIEIHPDVSFYVNYNTSINGTAGGGVLTGTAIGTPVISGAKLDLGLNTFNGVSYEIENNIDLGLSGCIRIKYIPMYDRWAPSSFPPYPPIATPPYQYNLFNINGSARNSITIYLKEERLHVSLKNDSGYESIYELSTSFEPKIGEVYEIEFDYDITNYSSPYIYLFVNGILKSSSSFDLSAPGGSYRDNVYAQSNFVIGSDGSTSRACGKIDIVAIFSTLQHSVDYTPDWYYVTSTGDFDEDLPSSVVLPSNTSTGFYLRFNPYYGGFFTNELYLAGSFGTITINLLATSITSGIRLLQADNTYGHLEFLSFLERDTGVFVFDNSIYYPGVGIPQELSTTFAVQSATKSDLSIISISLSGDDASDFILNTSSTGNILRFSDYTTFDVSLSPSTPGEKHANVEIYYNDITLSPYTIKLKASVFFIIHDYILTPDNYIIFEMEQFSSEIGGYDLYLSYDNIEFTRIDAKVDESLLKLRDISTYNKNGYTYYEYQCTGDYIYGRPLFFYIKVLSKSRSEIAISRPLEINTYPSKPGNLFISYDNYENQLSWDPVSYEDGNNCNFTEYQIYRNTVESINGTTIDGSLLYNSNFVIDDVLLVEDFLKRIKWFGVVTSTGYFDLSDKEITTTGVPETINIDNLRIYKKTGTPVYLGSTTDLIYIDTTFTKDMIYIYDVGVYTSY